MHIRNLTRDEVTALYKERLSFDFPRAERKSLKTILKTFDWGLYETLALIDDAGGIAGYAFFVRCGSDYFLDYLATDPEKRNRGLGSFFLSMLHERLSGANSMILEAEDPDSAESEEERVLQTRRIGFYRRNGMIDTGVTAVAFGVRYRILARACDAGLDRETIRTLYRGHYRACLSEWFCRRMIRI